MRYKVELLNLSERGQERELFHMVVYAENENEAIIKAQKEYAARHPASPLPPQDSSWISYGTREEDCWG
ncbi:MAG: hypothetical protein ABFD75_10400 [Smithella sp.]